MLRSALVAFCIVVGLGAALTGPFNGLLFYLWLAYFRPEAWIWDDWVSGLRLSFIAGSLVVALSFLRPSGARLRLDPIVGLLLAVAALTFVSARNSVAPEYSLRWWEEFAKILLIGFMITVHVTDMTRLRRLVLVLSLSLALEPAKQGWVQFLTRPGGANMNPHPVLGDNNGVAVGMFMLAPLLLSLAATATGRWERYFMRFMAVGVVLRGLSSWSRGGMLAACATVVSYLLRAKGRRLRVLLGASAVALLVVPVMPDAYWERMGTIAPTESERDASASGRLHFWRVALDMAAAHPVIGVGFNAYPLAYDSYDDSGVHGTQRAVHSSWFGMLAENGYPGLVLLLSAVLLGLRSSLLAQGLAERHPEDVAGRAYAIGLQTGLIAFVVGGSFVNVQYSELFWHYLCLTVALKGVVRQSRVPAQRPMNADQASGAAAGRLAPASTFLTTG